MKQEQVIELAKKAGFEAHVSFLNDPDGKELAEIFIWKMSQFASLVEQATLERAAMRLDLTEENEPGDTWQPGTPSEVIRNLAKDTQ
ncbi:hypothetical protein [Chryseobacterium sp.]|uniref:hypothetical protein n=1 Tax=Chryseobacterium sp. TaxID=1871047 RepID=UPI003219F2A2